MLSWLVRQGHRNTKNRDIFDAIQTQIADCKSGALCNVSTT